MGERINCHLFFPTFRQKCFACISFLKSQHHMPGCYYISIFVLISIEYALSRNIGSFDFQHTINPVRLQISVIFYNHPDYKCKKNYKQDTSCHKTNLFPFCHYTLSHPASILSASNDCFKMFFHTHYQFFSFSMTGKLVSIILFLSNSLFSMTGNHVGVILFSI